MIIQLDRLIEESKADDSVKTVMRLCRGVEQECRFKDSSQRDVRSGVRRNCTNWKSI